MVADGPSGPFAVVPPSLVGWVGPPGPCAAPVPVFLPLRALQASILMTGSGATPLPSTGLARTIRSALRHSCFDFSFLADPALLPYSPIGLISLSGHC